MWKIPKMWEGGEVWIIGGGYSLLHEFDVPKDIRQQVFDKQLPLSAYSPYLSAIHDKHIIGVNVAYQLGPWVDMVFFGDTGFFLRFREDLAKFRGIKVSCNPKFSGDNYSREQIKYVPKDQQYSRGITNNPWKVSWNQNSGTAAISLAVHAGAKRIVLLGFDMKLNKNGKQHWHSCYKTADRECIKPSKLPFARHTRGMMAVKKDAKRYGVEIINACPDSTIEEFKRISVKQLLNEKRD